MIVLYFLLSLFFWTYIEVFTVIVALLWLLARFLPDRGRRGLYFIVRCLIRFLFLACFIRVKVEGAENLPRKGRLIFISNKPNLIPTFGTIAYFPLRVRFVAEKRLLDFPFMGQLVRGIGAIMAAGKREDVFTFSRAIFSSLDGGEPVLFYPANIRHSESVSKFSGAEFRVAKLAGAWLVPVVAEGSEAVLPADSAIIRPGQLKLIIGRPVELAGSVDLADLGQKLEGLYR